MSDTSGLVYERDFNSKFDEAYRTHAERGGTISGLRIGNLVVRSNVISSSNVNGDISLTPNGTGQVVIAGNPISALGVANKQYVDLMAINHNHSASAITDFNVATDSRIALQKGQALGLATLDAGGKIPSSQLSLDVLIYRGTWNATSNTPTLASNVGIAGHYYIVSTAGSTAISGINSWQVGDKIIFNGTAWEKSSQSETISSVAGKQGIVVLDAGDITSGTFADARIAQSNITQYQGAINIQSLMNAPVGPVVGTTDVQTLTNKTINASENTITNIGNSNLSTGINVNKLANGTVSNAAFQYISTLSSNLQDQLDSKSANGHVHSASDITSGTFANARIAQSNITQHQSAINIQSLTGAPLSQVVGISDVQTLTNKIINAAHNTISNVGTNQLASGINVVKLANGAVTNAEFQHLSGVASNIQTQLNLKAGNTHTHGVDEINNFLTKVPKSNFNAARPPGENDDLNQGYTAGSRWLDTTNDEEYVCLHSTAGAAIWENTTYGGGNAGTIIIKDENTDVPGTPSSALNFMGSGVTVTNQGNGVARVTITASNNKLDATSLPSNNDDIDHGYTVGSHWMDITHSKLYVCFNSNAGQALWKEVQLNLFSEQHTIVTRVNTTDDAVTNLLSVETSTDSAILIESSIIARRTDASNEAAAYCLKSLYRNDGGILTKVTDDILEMEDDHTWAVESTTDNTNILITCKGSLTKNIAWKIVSRIISSD